MRRLPARLMAGALALVFMAGLMPTAQAGHPQGVTFDSLGGNQWWVDVQLGGNHEFYSWPEVRDSNGEWASMQHPDWAGPGRYVASYHVEPGHMVKFRVSYRDSVIVSCWFTHPAGNEVCDGSETFTATFTPSGTSERIGLRIDSSQPVSNVNWRVMGTQGSWGGPDMTRTSGALTTTSTWVSNVHVPDGEILQFSARSNDEWGRVIDSGCFRWPTATPVACPPSDYFSVQSPTSYDGVQSHMENQASYTGEDWPDGPTIQRMDVRFNGGDFRAMYLSHNNGWSDVYRYDSAPTTRSVAQYRAILSDGRTVCDQTGFFWPPAGFPTTYNTGETIQFTNPSGTTGWVQTNLYSSKPVVAVEVQVNNGPWQALQKQPWCDWAGAVDAPAGSLVRFRGFFPDLTSYTGDAMRWPPGTTATSTSTTTTTTTSTTTTSGSGFDATFTGVRGNEWWIQSNVASNGPTIAKVDMREYANGAWGPFQSLGKQTWGPNAWAASYHVPQGTIVQLRATSAAGATDLSSCRQWIPASNTDATLVTCPGGSTSTSTSSTSTTGSAFDASFSGVKGNEWWVQANVAANQPLTKVEARVDCGAYKPLTKQSWGGWAASFNVPAGSKITFRATSTSGATDSSSGYIWPNATPTSGC